MAIIIPCKTDIPHYDMQIVLDAVTFTLEFRWNTREASWYMRILTQEGEAILDGLKVVVDWPIGFRSADVRRPAGALIALDTMGEHLNPGQFDLGDRVQLSYFPFAELP